jgi:hypothetical protein
MTVQDHKDRLIAIMQQAQTVFSEKQEEYKKAAAQLEILEEIEPNEPVE